MKKVYKIVLFSLLGLLVLALLAGGLAMVILLSPGHLTPLANRVANQYLDAEVKVERVEVTFFSTFPHAGLELENGFMVLPNQADTLVRFAGCRLALDIKKYRREKFLSLRYVEVDSARVCVNASAGSDTTPSKTPVLPDLACRRIQLHNVDVRYKDTAAGLFVQLDNLGVEGSGNVADNVIAAALDIKISNVEAGRDSLRWAKNWPLGLHIKGTYDLNRQSGDIEEADIEIKRLHVALNGGFSADSATKNLALDFHAALQTRSLQELLDMVPAQVLPTQGVDADGEVDLRADVYGTYGHGRMPQMRLKLNLENGRVQYAGMPFPIDTVNTRLNAYIDLNKDTASYVNLEELSLSAQDVEVLTECRINRLLTDPHIDFKFSTDLDLGMVHKLVPLPTGLAMGGEVNADMDGKFKLSDAKSGNPGKIKARGKFLLKKVFYNDSAAGTFVDADAQVLFKDGKYLGGGCRINRMHCRLPGIRAYVDSMTVKVVSQIPEGKPAQGTVIPVKALVEYSKLFGSYNDSLRIFSVKSRITGQLKPDPDKPGRPRVEANLQTDSLYARYGGYRARLNAAKVKTVLTKTRRNEWWPLVNAELTRASVAMPQLSEPLQIRKFKGVLNGNDLEIEKARFRLGESRLKVSGKVWNIYSAMDAKGRIRADLKLTSRMLDCNQILNIAMQKADEDALEKRAENQMNERNESEEAAEDYKADTLQGLKLFSVPENWDLQLNLDAKRVYYDRMTFDSIKGRVDVRNRAVNLRDFTMQAWGADMNMNLVYANRGRHKADVGADVKLDDIRIDSLIHSFPGLDTTLPMLRAFEGIVDLEATASAQLDSNMNIMLPDLTAALRLHGDKLVVLDGKTFAEIAHLLSFENKDRNLIDSLSVTVTVQDGMITFHPFILEMDRCKVAAGGYQSMDMKTFRYHVTLLDAPWYVKGLRGVNIIGNPKKKRGFSVKLCAPVYKNEFTPEKVKRVDETRLNLGRQIMLQFEGWMNRERRKMDKVVIPQVEITDSI